jgi:hypothetical protein
MLPLLQQRLEACERYFPDSFAIRIPDEDEVIPIWISLEDRSTVLFLWQVIF